jgi:hypothetical protein
MKWKHRMSSEVELNFCALIRRKVHDISWFALAFKPNTEIVHKLQEGAAPFSCIHPYLNWTKLISFTVQPRKLFLELLTTYHFILFVSDGRAGQAWKPKYSPWLLYAFPFHPLVQYFLPSLFICLSVSVVGVRFKHFSSWQILQFDSRLAGRLFWYISVFSEGYIGIAYQNRPHDSYVHHYFHVQVHRHPAVGYHTPRN